MLIISKVNKDKQPFIKTLKREFIKAGYRTIKSKVALHADTFNADLLTIQNLVAE